MSSTGCCFICSSPVSTCECSKMYNKNTTNCILCFSKSHHATACPDRFKAQSFFLPNIDKDLISRFCQMLSLIEQCRLTFSSSDVLNLIKAKTFKIVNISTLEYDCFKKYANFIIAGVTDIHFFNVNSAIQNAKKFYDSEVLRNVVFKAKVVSLSQTTLSKAEFFQFLSLHTRVLRCHRLTVTSYVTKFHEILQNIPNIKMLELIETNIEIGKLWPENLLLKCNKKLEELQMDLNSIDFNVETFVEVVKKKMTKFAKINLNFDIHDEVECEKSCKALMEKLSKHFVSQDHINCNSPELHVSPELHILFQYDDKCIFKKYELKGVFNNSDEN